MNYSQSIENTCSHKNPKALLPNKHQIQNKGPQAQDSLRCRHSAMNKHLSWRRAGILKIRRKNNRIGQRATRAFVEVSIGQQKKKTIAKRTRKTNTDYLYLVFAQQS